MDWLLLLAVLCVLCMAAMVPIMLLGGHRHWSGHVWDTANGTLDRPETAQQVLDRRYASGELTAERYQQMRADLDRQRAAG